MPAPAPQFDPVMEAVNREIAKPDEDSRHLIGPLYKYIRPLRDCGKTWGLIHRLLLSYPALHVNPDFRAFCSSASRFDKRRRAEELRGVQRRLAVRPGRIADFVSRESNSQKASPVVGLTESGVACAPDAITDTRRPVSGNPRSGGKSSKS